MDQLLRMGLNVSEMLLLALGLVVLYGILYGIDFLRKRKTRE